VSAVATGTLTENGGIFARGLHRQPLGRERHDLLAALFLTFTQVPANRSEIVIEACGIRLTVTPDFLNDRVLPHDIMPAWIANASSGILL
jgi:hypothetical protein